MSTTKEKSPKLTLKIWTLQIAKWRLARNQHPTVPLVDVTVKSGVKTLAPAWDFLMAYKTSDKGPEAEETYKVKFAAKIKKLQEDEPDVMLELLHYGEMALMCYCPADKFCHRHLLVDEFVKLGLENNVEVTYVGEIR